MGKNSKAQNAGQIREYQEKRRRELAEKQKRQNRILLWSILGAVAVILIAVAVCLVIANATKKDDTPAETQKPTVPELVDYDASLFRSTDDVTDFVKLTVRYTTKTGETRDGEIIMQLFEEVAPATVKNFQKLVGEGFYNGLTFHRVSPGFMIQGGDPDGDGTGDAGETIKGEFTANGFVNNLKHTRGVVSMARSNGYNTASCQFFIVHQTTPDLDGKYASFGYVVSGMDVVDAITQVELTYNALDGKNTTPVHPVTIVRAEFVAKGDA